MSAKQLIKLILILCGAFITSYFLLWLSEGTASAVLTSILESYFIIIAFIGPATYALFSYVDHVCKDLIEIRNEVPRERYQAAFQALTRLKREIFSNGVLVVILFILSNTTSGLGEYLRSHYAMLSNSPVWDYSVLSIRISLFTASLVAVLTQTYGFNTALGLRDIIAINRK